MDEVIKKRTVIDRIKRAYIAHCRASGIEAQTGVDIYLGVDDVPKGVGIDFNELGAILLAIEKEPQYTGLITIEAVDDEDGKKSPEKRDCYRVSVNPGLLPRGASYDKKPKIMLSKGWWVISLPGKKELRIAKQGTLSGELLGVLGMAWGATRKTDIVYDLLRIRVTNKATEGRPTGKQIADAMKEINRPLKKHGYRGIKLIQKADELGGTWKFMLDALHPESEVFSSRGSKPTRHRKKPRNAGI